MRAALQLGLYQLLFLDRVAEHAAIAEAVELAKPSPGHRVVNAVLRRVQREGAELPSDATPAGAADPPLAPGVDRPALVGPARGRRDARAARRRQRARRARPARQPARRATTSRSIPRPQRGAHDRRRRAVRRARATRATRRARSRRSRARRSSSPRCSTRGRASACSTSARRPAARRPTSRRSWATRARSSRSSATRAAPAPCGSSGAADARLERAGRRRRREGRSATIDGFDRVLLDPPCSGLGTLRSHPDLRWRVTPRAVDAARRRAGRAAGRRAPRAAPRRTPRLLRLHHLPGRGTAGRGGRRTTYPHKDGTDGFYIARDGG